MQRFAWLLKVDCFNAKRCKYMVFNSFNFLVNFIRSYLLYPVNRSYYGIFIAQFITYCHFWTKGKNFSCTRRYCYFKKFTSLDTGYTACIYILITKVTILMWFNFKITDFDILWCKFICNFPAPFWCKFYFPFRIISMNTYQFFCVMMQLEKSKVNIVFNLYAWCF